MRRSAIPGLLKIGEQLDFSLGNGTTTPGTNGATGFYPQQQ